MSRRPPATRYGSLRRRDQRMAPGGRMWSESPVTVRRGLVLGEFTPTLSEVMRLTVYSGQLDWGTAGGVSALAGDVAIQAYAYGWNSSGADATTPTGWTQIASKQFDQIAAPNTYKIRLRVIYKVLTEDVAAGTSEWLTSNCWPYQPSGPTYTGAGTGMVLRGNVLTPQIDADDTLLNTGRTSMLAAPGTFGQQIIVGQSAVTLGTGARLVTNPSSGAYLRTFSSGQTVRGAMTKVLEGTSTGPLPQTTQIWGETLTGGTYVEHNYNYMRLALSWAP